MKYCFCILGWHFYEDFYETIYRIAGDKYIISHREKEFFAGRNDLHGLFERLKPDLYFCENRGLEWGGYHQFIDMDLYPNYDFVIFCHDDLVIKDLSLVDAIKEKFRDPKIKVVGNTKRADNRYDRYKDLMFFPDKDDFMFRTVRGSFLAARTDVFSVIGNFPVCWDSTRVRPGKSSLKNFGYLVTKNFGIDSIAYLDEDNVLDTKYLFEMSRGDFQETIVLIEKRKKRRKKALRVRIDSSEPDQIMDNQEPQELNGRLRDDPVIVLGMHHSGTSILAEILHRNGVFMHANIAHHESKLFTRKINDLLIMGGGANWASYPIMPVAQVMAKLDEIRAYIDEKAYKKYIEAGYDGHSRWGFKDPRTCVVLPLYLEIFPNAQLLHIIRNEDDVAASLAASKKKALGVNPDLDFWKALHRQHLSRAREYGTRHKHYYEFTYEDFCRRPVEVVKDVFKYLNVPFTDVIGQFLRKNIYTHRINVSSKPKTHMEEVTEYAS
jgi:hypothetical protein